MSDQSSAKDGIPRSQQQVSLAGLVATGACIGVAAFNSDAEWWSLMDLFAAILFAAILHVGLSNFAFDEIALKRIVGVLCLGTVLHICIANLIDNPFAAAGLVLGWVVASIVRAFEHWRATYND